MKVFQAVIGIPKMIITQAVQPLRVMMRKELSYPETQEEMAKLVNSALRHQIRAGFTHRFINILFVTVEDRVFCRRYSYGEPSWHSVFLKNPEGQIKLDKTIVNISCRPPEDMADIVPAVDQAYADKLKKLGASFMLNGAIEPRAQESTMEITLTAV